MTMLSRVAERLFWMARYLERAEDTARLTKAYAHLLMDIPVSSALDWGTLINIFDAESVFNSRQRQLNEQNVLRFLLADKSNPSSIISSISAARENVRTTRDVLPEEAWELTNEIYLYAGEFAEKSLGRRNRHQFLEQIIARTQQINGLVLTTLSRDHAYRFIKLGQLLERADMATRVIDIGAGIDTKADHSSEALNTLLWRSLLSSLSSLTAYRQYVGPNIELELVVKLVLKESVLPRSVLFCLRGILEEIKDLQNHTVTASIIEMTIADLTEFKVSEANKDKLHEFVSYLQARLCLISNTIGENWFWLR